MSRRRRKKRLKAPRLAGPRPKFFNYGNSNTQRPWINLLQTHNVSPEDPREIYPNALHAATRHPKYQEIALEKAAFLAKHKEEVSQAV